jgi:hypothetical protein
MRSAASGRFEIRRAMVITIVALAVLFGVRGARAQQSSTRAEQDRSAYRAAMVEADQKIADAAQAHSEVAQNLEYLTTYIGPRLTGSPGMQKASQWTLEMFRKYGLDARLEATTIPHAWARGNDWGELVTPVQHWMTVRSAAWGKATPGPVTGRLVAIGEDTKPEDVAAHPEKYKDAIVLAEDWPPCSVDLPRNPPNAYDAVVTAAARGVLRAFVHGGPEAAAILQRVENSNKVMAALAPAGAAAILRNSCMPDAMLHMGGAGGGYESSALPVAYVSHPDYQWLLRLAKAGRGTFRISLAGTFSAGPAPVANTVAQIRGSEHSDEQVIIGAHLDSWDLGQGAVDNGTGAMAVLEAARLLKSLGWTPKRTLTFVLFYGEEQGEVGARQFLHDHANEIAKIDAVLIDDTGAGRITSIALGNLWSTGPLMEEIYGPLQNVFDLEPLTNEEMSGSDHDHFQMTGVPAYLAVQEAAQYGYAHHSTGDVFELVQPKALRQQAAVLAAWMWNVSEMPEPFPHHPKLPGM